MLKTVKDFIKNEDGMGTIEIVVIIAVLVALALLFKDKIGTFAKDLMKEFFNAGKVTNGIKAGDKLPAGNSQ